MRAASQPFDRTPNCPLFESYFLDGSRRYRRGYVACLASRPCNGQLSDDPQRDHRDRDYVPGQRRERERLHHEDVQSDGEDAARRDANTADYKIFEHEITHDGRFGCTKRSEDANLASSASIVEACEANQSDARYGRYKRDHKRKYLDHGGFTRVGELT